VTPETSPPATVMAWFANCGDSVSSPRARSMYRPGGTFAIENDPLVVVDAVRDWTEGRGVDVILDLVGAAYLEANLKSLAAKGRMMLVGTTSGVEATLNFGMMLSKRLTLRGTVLRARSNEEKAAATRSFAQDVVPLLEKGIIQPVVDKVYRMDEIREAHRLMESNANFGKIVVVIDQ